MGDRVYTTQGVEIKKLLGLSVALCATAFLFVSQTHLRNLNYDVLKYAAVPRQNLEQRPSDSCDSECLEFRKLLVPESLGGKWPNTKPKAAIVLLIGEWGFPPAGSISAFLLNFDKHFNERFNYPVIIFHDVPDLNVTTRQKLRFKTRSSLFFQFVNFTEPNFIDLSAITNNCRRWGPRVYGLGYRHMCRFHAKTIYQQPIMRTESLEYVWRLDDDSRFTKPVNDDLFVKMRDQRLKYGYYKKNQDDPACVVGLWAAAGQYWEQAGIKQQFPLPNTWKFDNNFELAAMSLWRSKEYNHYIEFIDRLGGIFYSRWGDAPIKSIAVSWLVSENQTWQFRDVGYWHDGDDTHKIRV